jgi:hypothetical protein
MKDKNYEILIGHSTSLAIDSRTGKFYEYDPLQNPNTRKINDFLAMSSLIRLTHYDRKNNISKN